MEPRKFSEEAHDLLALAFAFEKGLYSILREVKVLKRRGTQLSWRV